MEQSEKGLGSTFSVLKEKKGEIATMKTRMGTVKTNQLKSLERTAINFKLYQRTMSGNF